MKYLFAFIAAVVMTTGSVYGQLNFGVKGGLNLYKLGYENDDKSDIKPGVHLGMLAHIHMSDQWALQPELYFSMQGARSENTGSTQRVNLNYINVPLLFQYMFDNGFRLQAGPQLGFLASAKSVNDDRSTNVKRNFNSIDFSVPLGMGYVAPSGFGVDARYNIGLSNVNENDDNKITNRGFQVGVFYLFNHQ